MSNRQLDSSAPAAVSTATLVRAPENGRSERSANFDQDETLLQEFGRAADVQRLFGIKRGTLYNLLAEGKVKSVSMRRKGNVHGCRLIYLPSVRAYLHSLMPDEAPISK